MEAAVGAIGALMGLLTWLHSQRQRVIDERFNSVKKRLENVENKVNDIPVHYASKKDVYNGMNEIKDRLNHINDKLDQLILSRCEPPN